MQNVLYVYLLNNFSPQVNYVVLVTFDVILVLLDLSSKVRTQLGFDGKL